jgi:hypothetical protein
MPVDKMVLMNGHQQDADYKPGSVAKNHLHLKSSDPRRGRIDLYVKAWHISNHPIPAGGGLICM